MEEEADKFEEEEEAEGKLLDEEKLSRESMWIAPKPPLRQKQKNDSKERMGKKGQVHAFLATLHKKLLEAFLLSRGEVSWSWPATIKALLEASSRSVEEVLIALAVSKSSWGLGFTHTVSL